MINFYFSRTCLRILILLLLAITGACNPRCRELSCGRDGPPVRFPFRLKDKQPHHCGSHGFDLTCTQNHQTLLEFPTPAGHVQLFIKHINYMSQTLEVYDPQDCLPNKYLKLKDSILLSPFTIEPPYSPFGISFFDCSSVSSSCPVLAVDSQDSFLCPELIFCTKMFDDESSLVSAGALKKNSLDLKWMKPDCSRCEWNGKICGLKDNGTTEEEEEDDDIQCLEASTDHESKIPKSIILAVEGVGGSIGLVILLLVVFQIYSYFRIKEEDQIRVEKFLDDYKALKPTRFSYADLKRITNNFKVKLGEGVHGAVFKGKLSNEILVAVKILNNTEGDGKDFINEVGTMGKIHHINVVRLLGFCADGFHRALVYDFFSNGSLQNFVTSPNKDNFLGWEKIQQIAVGIAKGIEYLHQGCDHQILHFDINPHNVLLDQNFVPKISDFGLAKLCSKNKSVVSMTAARGTLGYIAPEVFSRNFGNVSYKSDIYSYGMLLLEMVGGRKNTSAVEENFQVLYPEWIHNLVEGGDMSIHIEKEEENKIGKKLGIVGLWCIQWHAVNRPSIKSVVQMLEGEGDKLKVPPAPFDSTASVTTSTKIPSRSLNLELEVIHE
ncbi:rust resistance kinase Lr10-like [Senna tora]|uniref:Rust resistance kinase Lr10-like n=1 Tax=Senna tora TaxID=362788 RepID=A0A834TYK8_9FABA|nr:rust resistance kinase Lr10-like [Senna tora]